MKSNYLKYNIILLILYELKRKLFGTKYIAEIDITWKCQLNCLHCYCKEVYDKNERNINEWDLFFNNLFKKGIRYVLLVGGEPTLRMDVIDLAIKKFKFIDIITNGQIKIDNKHKCRIFLSLDGSRCINDEIRGYGTYDKAIKNYSGDNRVIINMTLTENNYTELENVIKISQANKFGGVVCNIITPSKVSEEQTDIISIEVRNSVINELNCIKKKYPKDLLLTSKVVKWYEMPNHTEYCFWRKNVLHYNFQFKTKYCFSNLDCRFCGCYAGASLSTKLPF